MGGTVLRALQETVSWVIILRSAWRKISIPFTDGLLRNVFKKQYKFSSVLPLWLSTYNSEKGTGLEILQDPQGRENPWSLDSSPLRRKVGSDTAERLATWIQTRFLLSPELTKRLCLMSFHSPSILGGCIILWMWYIRPSQLFKWHLLLLLGAGRWVLDCYPGHFYHNTIQRWLGHVW